MTTFAVLREITCLDGRITRNGGGYYRGTRYVDIELCGKPWDGDARKLKMKEVQIPSYLR